MSGGDHPPFDAVNLATSATEFFRGLFPIDTPHFPNECIELPWHAEYWTLCDDGKTLRPVSILDESDCIARELVRAQARPTKTVRGHKSLIKRRFSQSPTS